MLSDTIFLFANIAIYVVGFALIILGLTYAHRLRHESSDKSPYSDAPVPRLAVVEERRLDQRTRAVEPSSKDLAEARR